MGTQCERRAGHSDLSSLQVPALILPGPGALARRASLGLGVSTKSEV